MGRSVSRDVIENAPRNLRQLEALLTERDRYLAALVDIRAEISHGPTANWDFIEMRFAEALDA